MPEAVLESGGKPIYTVSTVSYGSGSIIVWGFFSSAGREKMVRVNGRMDRVKNMKKCCWSLKFIFNQDNNDKHKARDTVASQSKSPDLNLIQTTAVHQCSPSNVTELELFGKEEWGRSVGL